MTFQFSAMKAVLQQVHMMAAACGAAHAEAHSMQVWQHAIQACQYYQ
jgi:hypothetical protein